jgi:protein JSN1
MFKVNFERLDDAVKARKALNGRDVLGSDVGAIRIGFARVPTRGSSGELGAAEENGNTSVQGIGDLSVGASIHALRNVKGASTISADQQVLSGNVENYRSNLLLNLLAGAADSVAENLPSSPVTEQQMIMKALSAGSPDSDADVQALAGTFGFIHVLSTYHSHLEFRPPTMYYTTIPLVSDRTQSKRWDAAKLRELRKRLDSGSMGTHEVDEVASDFLDAEIVDLAADWLGNTVSWLTTNASLP